MWDYSSDGNGIGAAGSQQIPSTIKAKEFHVIGDKGQVLAVMDADNEGWRVVHFPDHRGPYQEGRIDMLGYEFVLEKFE